MKMYHCQHLSPSLSISHALKSSHCFPLQPMRLSFIWFTLTWTDFPLITLPQSYHRSPHWLVPATQPISCLNTACHFLPRPLRIPLSPLQCSAFILSPFFHLINADSPFPSHRRPHFFRPDSKPKSTFFVIGSHWTVFLSLEKEINLWLCIHTISECLLFR